MAGVANNNFCINSSTHLSKLHICKLRLSLNLNVSLSPLNY